jgi:hypothetical protein
MNETMHPTKEEWLKETGDLLEVFEEMNAEDRHVGRKIFPGRLDAMAEIRRTIEVYSKWTEEDLTPGEMRPRPARSETRNIRRTILICGKPRSDSSDHRHTRDAQ